MGHQGREAAARHFPLGGAIYLNRLFHTLRDVRKGYAEFLNCRERILEIQRVRIPIDPAELHHLKRSINSS